MGISEILDNQCSIFLFEPAESQSQSIDPVDLQLIFHQFMAEKERKK